MASSPNRLQKTGPSNDLSRLLLAPVSAERACWGATKADIGRWSVAEGRPRRDGGAGGGGASVPAWAGPDQLKAVFAFDLDEGGVDRGGEARVVELDREVVAAGLFGVLLPSRSELGVMWSST